MKYEIDKSRLIPLGILVLFAMIMSISCVGSRSVAHSDKRSVPNVIYDGDIGGDPCDYSTIAILLNYH
jgi:hypothetical protein